MKLDFNDRLEFNASLKTAVSVRDGVLEYLGSEIGMDPADKIFTVYRSPATIANTADKMIGIMLSDGHVPLDSEVPHPVGSVETSEMVDLFDHTSNSYLAIQNKVQVADEMLLHLQEGKRELSLGYKADLIPHEKYDLEQRDILPHHLAIVDQGRCGPACSFLDKKEIEKMKKFFLDAEGNPNLEEIVKIASQLPEALKKLPMDKLTEIMPTLQEIVSFAAAAEVPAEETPAEEVPAEEMPAEDETSAEEVPAEEMEDEEDTNKTPITDSAAFKDALKASMARHSSAIDKAKGFLDADYVFADKATEQIMRDALATEHGEQEFEDAELDVAFKMLAKTDSKTKNFGDSQDDAWDQLKDKEL